VRNRARAAYAGPRSARRRPGRRRRADVPVVCRRKGRPMRRCVDEPVRVDARGSHDEVRRGGQIAEHARADLKRVVLAGCHLGEAPHRDAAPALLDTEEAPVRHRLPEHRVGDVVGGESKRGDLEQHPAGLELGRGRNRSNDSGEGHPWRPGSPRLARPTPTARRTTSPPKPCGRCGPAGLEGPHHRHEGAADHTIDLDPEPTASEAIDGVWRSIEQRTPIDVVSRNGRRELVGFNAVHVIDVSVAAA
jgi:hypothetical protein